MIGRHRDFPLISLGVFALATAYGVINNEIIASLSPQHFTFYDPHYFPFENSPAQALCFALLSIGIPGLAWGILLYWAGHYGPGPIVGPRVTIAGAAVVVAITGATAWFVGWRESLSGMPPYPIFYFPSNDPKLYLSQTVQLTNYLVGFAGSSAWLVAIAAWRRFHVPVEEKET